jgi:hypothetical protein
MFLDVEGRGGRFRSRDSSGRKLGQAEIEDFGVAAISDKNVGGLYVAMNDSFGMRSIQRVRDVDTGRKQSAICLYWPTSMR